MPTEEEEWSRGFHSYTLQISRVEDKEHLRGEEKKNEVWENF